MNPRFPRAESYVLRLHYVFSLALFMTAPLFGQATSYEVQALIDTDNNASTGCIIATAAGPFAGLDQVVTTRVDGTTTAATVRGVTRQACTSPTANLLGPAITVDSGSWAAGLTAGNRLAIESHVRLSDLTSASTSNMRMAFAVSAGAWIGLHDHPMAGRDFLHGT